MVKRILMTVFLVLFLAGDAVVAARGAVVRVAILRDVDHCTLTVSGRYQIFDQNTSQRLGTGVHLRPALVDLKGGAIQVGDSFYDAQRIAIEPREDALVSVNSKHYRGSILFIDNGNGTMTVVNVLDLEQYIRGVLYHEISDKWPLEAIKAQAVATRTFAVYSMQQNAGKDYDMTSDIYSQVYGGRSAERYRTNLAVRRTRGQVLTYNGKVIPAFFHANSGGVTEDAKELWGIELPPLRGGVASPYSVGLPHYQWRQNFRLKDIRQKLTAHGYKIGDIGTIKVEERNHSGRVRKLEITSRGGDVIHLSGKEFRDVIGPNILRSNKYDVIMKGWYVDFEGYGWGHGVGMDQWGAYGMAKARFDYRKILSTYYPGSELSTFTDLD